MDEENPKINVVVKTSKNKETIQTESTATILEFKQLVSSKFNAPVPQLCLIFAGRILKDAETLESYSIKDGLTVHLVIKSDNRAQQQAAQHATHQSTTSSSSTSSTPQPQSNSTPQSSGSGSGSGNLDALGGLGMFGNSGNLQQMSQQLMSNPDVLRQVMDNPMVQSMMSNPDLIRQMILSNPQMQQLIERNPEISHIFNNPDLIRQTMEMMRNPSLMQEMMRTHDRALSNLESLPGGFNALQRMYTDIQEPMLNATQEQMRQAQNNPFAALFGGTGSETSGTNGPDSNPQQGTENTSPLPNPWSPSTPASSDQPTPRPTPQPPSQTDQQQTSQTGGSTTSSTSSTTTSPSTGGTSGNPMSSMFQTPAMQNLMQQMSGNPNMFQNMMHSPYMQDMMQRMVQNPELMASIIRSNPMFQGNTQLADQVASRLPEFMSQMQSPEFQQAVSNPRVMQAMMQIQQGMMQLQTEAPGLLPGMSMMGSPPSTTTTESTTSTGNSTTTSTPQTGTPGGTQSTPQAGTPPSSTPGNPLGSAQGNQMAQFMTQMMQAMTQTQNPEVTYRTQLEQLAQMGFVDRGRNIQALVATGGDLNAAIERLLQ
ncbi:ubiquilin-1-like [Montipora foliosa]|uniref:ubiquilin-1-like n=1 Tax=Montipora foliosa TaxID=591990 RepID=UPI0035F1FAC3